MRKSGIILHISSLPNRYGIGTIGKSAYDFVDFLKSSGVKIWQVLPIGQTGYGDSPYQSFSSFAGNPYFIDYDRLVEMGLMQESDLPTHEFDENNIDYGQQYFEKYKILRKSYNENYDRLKVSINEFRKEETWVEDYALFMSLKDHFGGQSWQDWSDLSIKKREPHAIELYRAILSNDINFYCYIQFIFYKEWKRLREYANLNGIEIFGDIPIYCSMDSCDVWANAECFQLDSELKPIDVAGVPPDYFCEDGQLWGNPLYNWDGLKENDYEFWINRLKGTVKLFDMIRLDHFIGFANYYAVPVDSENAKIGEWRDGPNEDLFEVINKKLDGIKIIAEDLGVVSEKVVELREKFNFPGMSVFVFMFDINKGLESGTYNLLENTVAYTGTHDNDTLKGWWSTQEVEMKEYILSYLNLENDENIVADLVDMCLSSNADTAIIPIQDYLLQDSDCRLNTPGTQGDNWRYRLKQEYLTETLSQKIKNLNIKFNRI